MTTTMINKSKPVKDIKEPDESSHGFSIEKLKIFIHEVKAEATKIVWPERKVTMGLTTVVIILSVVASIYLGTVDLLLGKLVSFILK
jgi:preprotein translocase subunit SecE